jgi:hypothetical protein
MNIRLLKFLLLGLILALLLLGHSYGGKWQNPRGGQPEQMQSLVEYDPELTHPFFKSNESSYWEGSRQVPDRGMWLGEKEPPRLKHTAKCFSTSFGVKHEVRFCEAKFIDDKRIDLFFNEHNPGFDDALRVQIRNGMFTCQYSTAYRAGPREGLIWTSKRQRLTLDKKEYHKGDQIKGRIDFECLDEFPKYPDRPPRLITVYGVFKTIVQ